MVAKNIFPFATMTEGCKEANFMGFSHEHDILDTSFGNFHKNVNFLKNSMKLTFWQPFVMVAKEKISFATMTHDCKAVIIDLFWSLLEIGINQ